MNASSTARDADDFVDVYFVHSTRQRTSELPRGPEWVTVSFRDLKFAYSRAWLKRTAYEVRTAQTPAVPPCTDRRVHGVTVQDVIRSLQLKIASLPEAGDLVQRDSLNRVMHNPPKWKGEGLRVYATLWSNMPDGRVHEEEGMLIGEGWEDIVDSLKCLEAVVPQKDDEESAEEKPKKTAALPKSHPVWEEKQG